MEILWLGSPDCHDANRTGAKAANLSRLMASYRIPPGFCVSAEAHARWAEMAGGIPPALYNALASAYHRLAEICGVANPSVAVRSSAVDEDEARRSFAGQHETYLNVVGIDAVAAAVVRCWASVRTARAVAYRRRQGLSDEGARLAVLVQQLVPADASAIVFSANPVTGSRDEVVINAVWGLGESIASGTVTPDTYVVCKSDLAIASRIVAEKGRATVLAYTGSHEVPVPRRRQRVPSIDDGQVVELARLGVALEFTMGWPVDIECSYRGGELYVVQCRPITTLGAL
jgi:pyruvate,water dikinase